MKTRIKIKVNDKIIDLGDGISGLYGSIETMGSSQSESARRDTVRIDFPFDREEYDKLGWTDYTPWSMIQETVAVSEVTEPIEKEIDMSAYYLICDIVEHQDSGNVSVYMGRPTDKELLEETISDLLS